MAKLKVGDTVLWSGGFGSEPLKEAKVMGVKKTTLKTGSILKILKSRSKI